MGRHHAEVFKALQQQYGSDSVYVVTSNKVAPPKSPLDFEEKKEIMVKHGIPDSQIIQAVSPYRIGELADQFDAEGDVIIYAVGKKDMDESPRFKNLDGKKRDGNPTYLRSYDKNKDSLEPFENHAYVAIAPHVSIKLPNGEEMSGSTLRDAMRNLTPESFEGVMGWFDKDIYEMLKSKINKSVTSLSETIFSIIEEALNEKLKAPDGAGEYVKDFYKSKATQFKGKSKKKKRQMAVAAYLQDKEETNELNTGVSTYYGSNSLDKKPKKKKYIEPSLNDDYESENPEPIEDATDGDYDFEEIEEMSSMAGGSVQGYSLPLGARPKFKKKKK